MLFTQIMTYYSKGNFVNNQVIHFMEFSNEMNVTCLLAQNNLPISFMRVKHFAFLIGRLCYFQLHKCITNLCCFSAFNLHLSNNVM